MLERAWEGTDMNLWPTVALLAFFALSGCGVETAGTAATSAAAESRNSSRRKKPSTIQAENRAGSTSPAAAVASSGIV